MFQQRSLIVHRTGDEHLRVVWTEPGKTWVMSLDRGKSAWPQLLPPDQHDRFETVDEPPAPAPSKAALKHAQRTFEKYGGVLEHIPGLLIEAGRWKAYSTLKALHPTLSTSTFYKVVRRWLRGGAVVASLSPEWKGVRQALDFIDIKSVGEAESLRACREQSERLMKRPLVEAPESDHTRNGKPRKRFPVVQPTEYKTDRPTLRVFYTYFKRRLHTPGMTLKAAFKQMLEEAFATKTPTGASVFWPNWVVPSFAQFEFWFKKMTSNRERRVAIVGDHAFELGERSLLGQGVSIAYMAGAIGELDATVWNVELVSEFPGARPIGSPIVFRIRCKDTGQLLGLSVGLESASWIGAASAIANCVEDKVAFCKKFDVDIASEDWMVRGLPPTIVADCGETHNHKPNRFITTTRTNLKNLQRARGDLKPGVESDFNTLQVKLNGLTPGAIIKAYEELSLRQWRMKSAMTLRAFTRLLILAELIRMREPRDGLQLPSFMTDAGVNSSPRAMWSWCTTNMPTTLRTFDEDSVKLSLLNTDDGSITEHGVEFYGVLYKSQPLIDSGAFEIARRRGRTRKTIGYDPRLVDVVYILEEDAGNPSRYVRCDLIESRVDQRDFKGKTFREVRQLIRRGDRLNSDAEADSRTPVGRWTHLQNETIADSKERTARERKEHPASANSLHESRATAREAEKNALSPSQALVPAADLQAAALEAAPVTTAVSPSSNVVGIATSRAKRLSGFAARAAAAKMQPIANPVPKTNRN